MRMQEGTKRKLSLFGTIMVVVFWGFAPLAGKYLFNVGAYSPALLIAVRGLISTLVLGVYILVSKRYRKINKSYWICLPAGFVMGGAYLLQFIGLETTSLSKNTFLESFSVIAVPLTMFILTRNRPSIASVFASIFCFFGCFVLCGNGWDFSAFFTAPTLGDILSAVAGALFGVNIAMTKVYGTDKDPYVYVFFLLLMMTVMSFGYALPFEKNLSYSFEFPHVMTVLFLALVCTIGCWVLRTVCLRRVGSVTAAVLNPMSAVLATGLSMAFGMEGFSWNIVAGGLIITVSIVVSGVVDAKIEKRKPETNREG